jgi:hypothetical protein
VRPPTATELDESGGDASLLAGVTRDGRGVYRVRLSDDRPTEDGAPYSEEYFYYRRKAHLRRYTRLTRVPHTAGHVHFARILIKRRAATSFAELRTTTLEPSCAQLNATSRGSTTAAAANVVNARTDVVVPSYRSTR